MKLKKSLVEQIIKEEALKIKKIMVLKEEKERIIKQLNELYEEEAEVEEVGNEEEMVDEIFGNLFGSKKVSREEAIKIISNHPVKKQAYLKAKAENPEKAEKYIQYIMNHPDAKYIKWNPETQNFEIAGTETHTQHGFGSGAAGHEE
jgi:hypothetical protein